ncbi:MAG TPA: hypothetical protein VHO68_10000 [Bacteroidales bacterium]|nr:hypothetical protein [Bacteroidales bacterium]
MKKILFMLAVITFIVFTVLSCSSSREVSVKERKNDNGVVIKKRKTVTDDNGKDVTVKVKKERDRKRDRNDEPALIIDKDR